MRRFSCSRLAVHRRGRPPRGRGLAAVSRPRAQRRVRGPALAETWGAEGPRVVWRKTVGQGFSGPVVVQGRVILFHRIGNEEIVDAIDARTGDGAVALRLSDDVPR